MGGASIRRRGVRTPIGVSGNWMLYSGENIENIVGRFENLTNKNEISHPFLQREHNILKANLGEDA